MNTTIFTDKASMTSVEIAELVGKRHDNVKRTIETLAKGGVVRSPQIEVSERINNLGFKVQHEHYLFEGEQGKRDSIIVVAQLCPEFTARLVDRWRELEEQIRKPMSQIEMVAAMALEAVRQQNVLSRWKRKSPTLLKPSSESKEAPYAMVMQAIVSWRRKRVCQMRNAAIW